MSSNESPSRLRRSRSQINQLLRAQEGSGLTQAAFARRRGIPLSTFTNWRRKFWREDQPGPEQFIPVKINPEPSVQPLFEVHLPQGVTVVVRPGFSKDDLKRLLEAIG